MVGSNTATRSLAATIGGIAVALAVTCAPAGDGLSGAAPGRPESRPWQATASDSPRAARAGALEAEPATPSALALRWAIHGDANGNGVVQVAYRKLGELSWRAAFPLFWVHPDHAPAAQRVSGGRLFAGSILDLAPETSYQLRLVLIDPDGGSETRSLTLRTTVEPAEPSGLSLQRVGGTDGVALATALDQAMPGQVLLIHAGHYKIAGARPARSGRPGRPIVLRAAGDGPVVLDGGDANTLLDLSGLAHIWLEGVTLRNADVLLRAEGTRHLVVRHSRFELSDKRRAMGIDAQRPGELGSTGFFITDNRFVGPNSWPRPSTKRRDSDRIYGIALAGSGHVVAHNVMHGLGDGVHNSGDAWLWASDINNNDIFDATDDCIEADYGATNLRVFRNRLTNCFAGISAQPAVGGPLYIYRNLILNTQHSPFKLHNHTSGVLLFHNTSLRAGIPFHLRPGRETVNDVVTRNNLFIGTTGPALKSSGQMIRDDFGNDGFNRHPGSFALWNGRTYAAPAEGGPYADLGPILLDPDGLFASGLTAPDSHESRQDPATNDPRLAAGTAAIDAGVALANVNDGFAGQAPDLGCCELGSPLPHFGPRPARASGHSALRDLPVGRWTKIHQQSPDDQVTFTRQKHGGSAFDSRRGRIVLFGSDTHSGNDWTNSPLFFDLGDLTWRRLYPDDDPASYRVNSDGLPVAGLAGDHPWAMHTFGAVSYDPLADALVVASYPRHMVPGRFSDALAPLWPQVQRHPTWVLNLASGRWRALPGKAVHFFPHATAYDSDQGQILGYRSKGVYQLSLETGQWRRLAKGGLLGWGNNVVYDSRHQALVVFGSHKKGNDLVVFEPATGRHQVMPTPGLRPSGDTYVPLAYHPAIERTVALIDRRSETDSRDRSKATAETWLYDLGADAWSRVENADLPFGLDMNYNLHYEPARRLLLLVADPPGEPVAVWALRLESP